MFERIIYAIFPWLKKNNETNSNTADTNNSDGENQNTQLNRNENFGANPSRLRVAYKINASDLLNLLDVPFSFDELNSEELDILNSYSDNFESDYSEDEIRKKSIIGLQFKFVEKSAAVKYIQIWQVYYFKDIELS